MRQSNETAEQVMVMEQQLQQAHERLEKERQEHDSARKEFDQKIANMNKSVCC